MKSHWKTEDDGVTHVNVYSKGKTELGRQLSNFAHTPFYLTPEGRFESVEGFWYWVVTGNDALKRLHGFKAKELGRTLKTVKPEGPNREQLKRAYEAKLKYHPHLHHKLAECRLPLAHYYVYGDKTVTPEEFAWTVVLWDEFR